MPSENDVRAMLIEMRKYIMHHGILIGECVAWNKLKDLYGVGADQDANERWLREYQAKGTCRLCGGKGVIDRPVICGPDTPEHEMGRLAEEAGGPIPCLSCQRRSGNVR